MVKKTFPSGPAIASPRVGKFILTRRRRGPRNDVQIVQRIAWTNVNKGVVTETGTDIFE